jgi:hypothetical protein
MRLLCLQLLLHDLCRWIMSCSLCVKCFCATTCQFRSYEWCPDAVAVPSTLISCSVSFGTDGNPHPTDELSKCSTDILRWFIGSYIFWDQFLNMCTELIPVLNPPLYQTRCFFRVSMCAQPKCRVSNTKFHSIGQMLGKIKNSCQMLLWYIV